jgi:hypothetical protein
MNSSRIELLWLAWDQSRSKYYLRTKFQDGIDLILVLHDFIVQNILSLLLFLCYNLMIMNDYE